MTTPEHQQEYLDRLSITLADLEFADRICVVTNSFVATCEGDGVRVVSCLAQVMASLAIELDDDEIKRRVVAGLRDVASIFERTIRPKEHLH